MNGIGDSRVMDEHLDPESVAACLDGALSEIERARVEAHLADCDECRQELVEVGDFVGRERNRRWRYVIGSTAAAAAGIVAFVLLVPDIAERDARREPVLREGVPTMSPDGVPTFEAIDPAPSATIELVDRPLFRWRSAADGSSYRITLTDDEGRTLWLLESVTGTSARLPSDITLQRDRVYYWYVDALLPDGSTATTRVRRFRTPP